MQGCHSSSSCSCVCRSSNQRTRRITLGRSADRPEKPRDSRRAPGRVTSRTRRISVIMTKTTTVYCKVPLSVAPPRGMVGKLPRYGRTSKNYEICVCFHCHGTSSYHTTNTLQGRRAKSHVDTQTIQPGLGDFVL